MKRKPKYDPAAGIRYKTVIRIWNFENWVWNKIDKFFFWLTEKTWEMKYK